MIVVSIIGFTVLLLLAGCVRNTPEAQYTQTQVKSEEEYQLDSKIVERKKIFKVYDNDNPNTIILAYEKIYNDTFYIAKNYLQYSKETNTPTYDGFWVWLIKNVWYKEIFDEGDKFGIGEWLISYRFNHQDYKEIKKNYELLEKMQGANTK